MFEEATAVSRHYDLPSRLVLATGNAGKVAEMNHRLTALGVEVLPQSLLDVPEIDETGWSFVENAILKARNAARHTGLPALADDSGIEVDALQGAPGIYSARYAGPGANADDNNRKLLQAMREVPAGKRAARFHCAIVFMRHAMDPMPLLCGGTWEGSLLEAPRGHGGFGYDPLFFVPTHNCSAAELPPEIKNQISHRAQAIQSLLKALGSE